MKLDITEKLVENTVWQLGEGETHDIVEAIYKQYPDDIKKTMKEKDVIKKKVLKILKGLREKGRVGKVRRHRERIGDDRKIVVETEVWVPTGMLRDEDMPPLGRYFKIPDEKMVIEASSKALSEWCEKTYKVATEVRVKDSKKKFEGKEGKLILYITVENVKGIIKVEVGSASLPSFNALCPATYMVKLVFSLQGSSFDSGPGAPVARIIQVRSDGSEQDMGKCPFAPVWVASLNAYPDDPSFSLLYHYEMPSRSVSLLENLLKDALKESIGELCRKCGVSYTVRWFQTLLYPKVEGGVIHAIGTENLSCAIKNLLSAKYNADLHLISFKKRLVDLIMGQK